MIKLFSTENMQRIYLLLRLFIACVFIDARNINE